MNDITYKLKITTISGKTFYEHIGIEIKRKEREIESIENMIKLLLKEPAIYVFNEEAVGTSGAKRKNYLFLSTDKIETMEVEGKVSQT